MTSKSESAVNTINELLSDSGAGSLGTNHSSGTPFVSLVNVARFSATELVMLLSGLAQHTRKYVLQRFPDESQLDFLKFLKVSTLLVAAVD